MARRGRKRQLGTESEYWHLLLSGIWTVVGDRDGRGVPGGGIGRKTGYRWRAENGGLPPGRLAESARSGRYPSLLERHADRDLAPAWIRRPGDRGAAGPGAVNGEPGTTPQHASARPRHLQRPSGSRPGPGANSPSAAGPPDSGSGSTGGGPGRAGAVRSMRERLAARSAVSVGYLLRRSRTPGWPSRSPTAPSRTGEMLVSASRSRLASRVASAARSMSNPLSTRSWASSSSEPASSQWTCLRRVRPVSAST
jgi:hypothetical protein